VTYGELVEVLDHDTIDRKELTDNHISWCEQRGNEQKKAGTINIHRVGGSA
jgi:hypothetical protein